MIIALCWTRKTYIPCFLVAIATFALLDVPHLYPQAGTRTTVATPTAFDVISVKPTRPGDLNLNLQTSLSSFHAEAMPLKDLLFYAYGVRRDLITGLPAWANEARFDIDAKIMDPDLSALGQMSFEQRRPLIANILEDRFHLLVHKEKKIMPVLELTTLKGGPKFREAAVSEAAVGSIRPNPGDMTVSYNEMTATAIPISSLTLMLERQLGRTVIDKTLLTGRYDLTLRWTPDDLGKGTALDQGSTQDAPGILTAVESELGLRLTPSRGPVETLVIDSVVPPTPN